MPPGGRDDHASATAHKYDTANSLPGAGALVALPPSPSPNTAVSNAARACARRDATKHRRQLYRRVSDDDKMGEKPFTMSARNFSPSVTGRAPYHIWASGFGLRTAALPSQCQLEMMPAMSALPLLSSSRRAKYRHRLVEASPSATAKMQSPSEILLRYLFDAAQSA